MEYWNIHSKGVTLMNYEMSLEPWPTNANYLPRKLHFGCLNVFAFIQSVSDWLGLPISIANCSAAIYFYSLIQGWPTQMILRAEMHHNFVTIFEYMVAQKMYFINYIGVHYFSHYKKMRFVKMWCKMFKTGPGLATLGLKITRWKMYIGI